jgi:hypothetical protein
MYQYELGRLARISRGVFAPTDIDELALDRIVGGDVLLTFRARGAIREYTIAGGNHDWIDWRLLWIAQEHMSTSPYRLHAAEDPQPAQGIFLVALSEPERARILQERGLAFAPLPDAPVEPWQWWWDIA